MNLFSEDRKDKYKDLNSKNTELEEKLLDVIRKDVESAETQKDECLDETGLSTIDRWDDEYRILRGGGLQWTTKAAYRSEKKRKIRPNSENNFVHSAIETLTANLTAHKHEVAIRAKETQAKQALTLTHMSNYNDYKNDFLSLWREAVKDFVAYGPIILKVTWDPDMVGGAGPDRYVGDVSLTHVLKEEFLIDPAILHMERDSQKARFLGIKTRQFVCYVQSRWPDHADRIGIDNDSDLIKNEGIGDSSTTLYEMYYKGFPEYISPERKRELLDRAMAAEEEGDFYKAKDLYDMAEGDLEGVHLAYYSNNTLLEYVPYVYDHGKFPFVFKVRYKDIKNPWGYGEIMNTKIPQILHNKADEIEIEAMAKEGLGGGYYDQNAIDDKQLDNIIDNSGRSGMWFAVRSIAGIRERTGVKVPSSILAYKEHKQRMVETISSNTPVSQGLSPGANTPYRAIVALGARADIRIQQAADILKDLLIDLNQIRIQLFAQFYTEERYYRYTDSNNILQEGTFKNTDIMDEWQRGERPAELGEEITEEVSVGLPIPKADNLIERFIPDFDIEVFVLSKKPDDRSYNANLAFALYERQLLAGKDLLKTLEEGFLPDAADIVANKAEENQVVALMEKLHKLPEMIRGSAMEAMEESIDTTVIQAMQQMEMAAQGPQMPQPIPQQSPQPSPQQMPRPQPVPMPQMSTPGQAQY